jgi:tetratricopeptide (TPR) repeat protein
MAMRTFVPRAALAAALVATVAGCASGGGAGVALGTDTGGRYLVMIPAFAGPSGAQVAGELRGLVMDMATHVALSDREVRRTMSEYEVEELNEVASRQLASLIGAQLVFWGEVSQVGTGFEADVKVVDSRSGDEITLSDVAGATVPELAANIFVGFGRAVEGIAQAGYCNDYLSSNNFEQALQNCEAALAIVPTSGTALYGKATALLQLDRNEEALEAYRALLEVDPTHSDALLGAGLAASRLTQREDAMAFYRRYLQINPGSADVRMTVANDIAQAGDYVSAFRVLELGMAELREHTEFQTYLFQMGAAAGRALRVEGDTATAHAVLTTAYDAYERGYGSATEVDQTVLQRVVEVTSALGRSEEAIQLARQSTQRFPDQPSAWSMLATALRGAERTEEEIEALTRLSAISPEDVDVYIRRAQAFRRAGQRQRAIDDARHAGSLGDRARAAAVIYGIGSELFEAENFAEAESILNAAYDLAEGDLRSQIAFLRGFSLYRQGAALQRAATPTGNLQQFQQALEIFRRALPVAQSSRQPQAVEVAATIEQHIDQLTTIIQSIRR